MPILLLLLSQTVMIESIYVWLSTVLIMLSIAGVAWRGAIIISKKADIDKVIPRIEYEKDIAKVNNDLMDFCDDLEDYKARLERHENLYHAIDKKLDILVNDVTYIKKNCDKQTCKK